MSEFREVLEGIGLGTPRTYIQSGNAVFESGQSPAQLETAIQSAVEARFGFAPEVFVLTAGEIAMATSDHPFTGSDPRLVHVCFLRETPALDSSALEALALPGDGWHVGPCRFTLHTPAGYGRSKLAQRLPKLLPTPMTARNLHTVAALAAMAE